MEISVNAAIAGVLWEVAGIFYMKRRTKNSTEAFLGAHHVLVSPPTGFGKSLPS